MRLPSGILITPIALVASAASVRATVYLTPEQAVKAIFPERPEPAAGAFKEFTLTDDERERVKAATDLRVKDAPRRVWVADDGARVYIDSVTGKHDNITFAVGVKADGTVAGVEILEYRETYGGEIRRAEWRAQFPGKRHGDTLRLNKDIKNITGATLSCKSVTDGVKRLLAIRALVHANEAKH